jgi:hypothetical protein
MVCDTSKILEVAVGFYKNLFKKKSRGNFSLEPDFWDAGDKVSTVDCEALEAPFSEEEIKTAVFEC